MSDELKLLYAMCSAMGLEVTRTLNYDEREEIEWNRKYFSLITDYPYAKGRQLVTDTGGAFKRSENNGYYSRLDTPEVTFTVAPRPDVYAQA